LNDLTIDNRPTSRPYTVGDFCRLLYVPAALLISSDLFLSFNVGGLNIRVAQLLLIFPIATWAIGIGRTGRTKWPLGFSALLAWTFILLAFVPNTSYFARSAGYWFWLAFNAAVIVTTLHVFSDREKVLQLVRLYIWSFVFPAAFGLAQFVLGVTGLGAPLVVQWFIPGVLPRVNGFCYEPSYFSTYLLMGWVMTSYLLDTKSSLIRKRHLISIFVLLTLALAVSSSRMGILMMSLWLARYPAIFFIRLCRGRLNKRYLRFSATAAALILPMIVAYLALVGLDRVSVLTQGLEIEGRPGNSVVIRMGGAADTWRAFTKSPIIGYSLGGVAGAIGELNGVTVRDSQAAKRYEGLCVFLEVLAASGVIGFIPFVLYILSLTVNPLLLASRCPDSETRKLLKASVLALLFELAILQFNQNILRPYLWFHIAMLSALYASARPMVEPRLPSGTR
jgi:hypothetical protein